ncbi:pyridoxal phosphate-dependent decarboxylase family protein [Nocardiopsis trehalosi]|jgi:glutamate/tyrosine decarboxylase-like PLP-dependent enzyme|uniref:pyridoxal phosphate-dependent decarboxylase family protein n=1 Tax=Nocardiopsis trehalosi TaxID=109329 RepID=UPI000831CADD|nr:pyridoxal-dependent decarboxylase [Nocardiopsis trehalosi]
MENRSPDPAGDALGVLDLVARYARASTRRPRPVAAAAPGLLADLLGGPVPEAGADAAATVRRLIRAGEAGTVDTGGAHSFGYVIGGALPVGVAADWLTSLWDQCAATPDASPLAATAEDVCARWLVDLLGLPPGTVMGLTSGCTTANLVCLAAARDDQLRRAGWSVREQGMRGAPPLTVLVGRETHVSVLRCLRLLGLGGQVHRVRADGEGRMDARHLARLADRAEGGLIVCGEVGSTNTGSVDPLPRLAEVVRARGGWLHLDGAFGLWAAASPRLRPLLDGVALADSWSCDGHKWLNTPYDCGLALCARPDAFHRAVAVHADYVHPGGGTGPAAPAGDAAPAVAGGADGPAAPAPVRGAAPGGDQVDRRVEFSQRSRAITLWAVLHHLGRAGLAALVERNVDAAQGLARALAGEPGIELLAPVRLNQVLLRVGDDDRTRRLVDRLNTGGAVWVTRTRWRGRGAVRLSVCSWRTGPAEAEAAADAIRAAHRALGP